MNFLTNLTPDTISALAAVLGALIVKIIERRMLNANAKLENEHDSNDDLRDSLSTTRAENVLLQAEIQALETRLQHMKALHDTGEHKQMAEDIDQLYDSIETLKKSLKKTRPRGGSPRDDK